MHSFVELEATERVNVAVTLLTSIREVPDPNLSRDTGQTDSFRGFSQFLQASFVVMYWLGHDRFVPNESFVTIIFGAV
jgi:hypothetical protein